jgi:EmrB/QacA subfamily drug resistance transporter
MASSEGQQQADTEPAHSADRRMRIALFVLCAATFLDSLDVSMVGVALPSIKRDLGMSTAEAQWLISGYTVAYGGFLLLGGRVADLFGRRKVFLAAMCLFAVASLLGGVVSIGPLLIATRVVKGLGAAFTAPAALSIITTSFREGPERNRALGLFAATAASGYSIGLVMSGLLTEVNWRLVFFVPTIVAVIVVIVARFVVRSDEAESGSRRSLDLGGTLAVTGGLLLFVYGVVQAPTEGWTSPATLGTLAGAVILLGIFLLVEKRQRDPAVPLVIFRSRTLSTANIMAVLFGCASIGWQFVATLYLQQFLHYSPLKTALAVLPLGVAVLVVAQFVAPRLIDWVGIRVVAGTGVLIQATGIAMFAFAGVHGNYPEIMLPGLLLHGIGNGLVFPTMNIAGVSGVDNRRQGVAGGLVTASVQIGSGIGTAVLAGVLAAETLGSTAAGVFHGYQIAFSAAALFAVVSSAVAWIGLRARGASQAPDRAASPDAAAEPARG